MTRNFHYYRSLFSWVHTEYLQMVMFFHGCVCVCLCVLDIKLSHKLFREYKVFYLCRIYAILVYIFHTLTPMTITKKVKLGPITYHAICKSCSYFYKYITTNTNSMFDVILCSFVSTCLNQDPTHKICHFWFWHSHSSHLHTIYFYTCFLPHEWVIRTNLG